MSKGLGLIQRQLIEVFEENGHKIFSTEALCRAIFKVTRVQKKHRVSVLRGLRGVTRHGTMNIYRAVWKGHRDDLWFDRDKAKSALNDLLHKAGARNIDIAPAKDSRPSK
jgi:hypothetical protein